MLAALFSARFPKWNLRFCWNITRGKHSSSLHLIRQAHPQVAELLDFTSCPWRDTCLPRLRFDLCQNSWCSAGCRESRFFHFQSVVCVSYLGPQERSWEITSEPRVFFVGTWLLPVVCWWEGLAWVQPGAFGKDSHRPEWHRGPSPGICFWIKPEDGGNC